MGGGRVNGFRFWLSISHCHYYVNSKSKSFNLYLNVCNVVQSKLCIIYWKWCPHSMFLRPLYLQPSSTYCSIQFIGILNLLYSVIAVVDCFKCVTVEIGMELQTSWLQFQCLLLVFRRNSEKLDATWCQPMASYKNCAPF